MSFSLYVASNVAAAAIGIVMTSPIGSLHMPQARSNEAARASYSIDVSSSSGSKIGEFRQHGPGEIEIDKLPEDLVNAVIATEDTRFLEHRGLDPQGLASATLDALRGELRGGSTLTQQLAKNALTGSARSLDRKVLEALVATRIEARLSKKEILRAYLEQVWLGRGAGGMADASQDWLGKPWSEVSLAESAMFAAMLKGPSLYDPYRRPDLVEKRRNAILDRMLGLGWISQTAHDAAVKAPVEVLSPRASPELRSWEQSAIAHDLERAADLPKHGTAQSSIDPLWQSLSQGVLSEEIRSLSPVKAPRRLAEKALEDFIAAGDLARLPADMAIPLPVGSQYETGLLLARSGAGWDILTQTRGVVRGASLQVSQNRWTPKPGDIVPLVRLNPAGGAIAYAAILPTQFEAAAVLIDPRSGEILASIGGVDPNLSTFDRTRARRQPGSATKPFLYLAALGLGFDAYSPVEDREYDWIDASGEVWHPQNYDHRQLGDIPMYAALERSSNLAAAWLAHRVGIEAMAEMAEAAGVYPANGMLRVPSAALGTSETTLRDLTSGIGAIVNDGMPRVPHVLRALTGPEGEKVPQDFRREGPIAGRAALQQILSMMRGVTLRGTASVAFAKSTVPIVGKTGTTQDHRDAWFVGATPQLAIGIWIGRDDNRPLPTTVAGGSGAAPIAAAILKDALEFGLIDAEGLRDSAATSSLSWPPEAFPEANGDQNAGADQNLDQSDIGSSDFWGILEDRRGQR